MPICNRAATSSMTDISSQITAEMYKDALTGMRLDFNHEILEQINQNTLSTRPPREQMYYVLLSERTIHFDEKLNLLQLTPYANDLIEILMKYAYCLYYYSSCLSELLT